MTAHTKSTSAGAPPVSRREFLFYLGGASAVLFSASICSALYQYITRSVPLDQQPEVFAVEIEGLHLEHSPSYVPEAAAFLSLLDGGLLALDAACTFRHEARVVWVGINNRFECPTCGSKFSRDGSTLSGPASRGLDHYHLWAKEPDGTFTSARDDAPLPLSDAARVFIDRRTIFHGVPVALKETSFTPNS